MRDAIGWAALTGGVFCLMFLGFGSTNPFVLWGAAVCSVACIGAFTTSKPRTVSRHYQRKASE